MKKQEFIDFLQSQANISLSEYFCEKLNDFINAESTTEAEFEKLAQNVIALKKKYINDNDLVEVLKKNLLDQAEQRASRAKIEKYKGTRYEEEQILKMYFFKKNAQEKGIEWIL